LPESERKAGIKRLRLIVNLQNHSNEFTIRTL
jgi:hypothetical protein